MTAPGPRTPERGDPDLSPFAAAEKLAAQWEAQHSGNATGRRSAPLDLSQYMAHEHSTEAFAAAAHPKPHPPSTDHPAGRARPAAAPPEPAEPARKRTGLFGRARKGGGHAGS